MDKTTKLILVFMVGVILFLPEIRDLIRRKSPIQPEKSEVKDSCLVINNGDTIGYFPYTVIKEGPFELTGSAWWYNGGRGRNLLNPYETTEIDDSILKKLIDYYEFDKY